MTLIEVLTAAQEKRQAALDLIIERPGITSTEIVEILDWKKSSGSARLVDMAKWGEITGTPTVYEVPGAAKGKDRYRAVMAYTALVTTTKQAVDVFASMNRMQVSHGRKSRAKQIEQPVSKDHNVWINGSYRNNPNNRAAISNQGGQGSYAPRMATYLETMA